MTNSDRAIYILGFLIIFTIISFVTGSPFLSEEIIPTLPNGNVLIMAALMSCGVVGRIITWTYKRIHRLNTITIVMGALWYPIGILLSGNTGLNFTNDSQDSFVFDIITAIIIAACFGLLLFSVGFRLTMIVRRKWRRS